MADAAAIGDFKIIRWLIGHWDEAQEIFDAIQLAIEAPTLREKILALKPVIDAIALIVDDFPTGETFADVGEEPLRADASARGINWSRLMEIVEKLKPFLPIILMFLEENPNA
jgi:hypothetical protein